MEEPQPGALPVAALIAAADKGDRSAADQLFTFLYSELHRLAQRQLNRAAAGPVTIGATTLLHEAYLDISRRTGATFPDEARFMGYAARVMRGLIVEHTRNRQTQKRGGRFEFTSVSTDVLENAVDERPLAAISEALDDLALHDGSLAEVVDLKFFCGFTFAEIGAMHGVSERTVQRQWDRARIYLHRCLRGDDGILSER